nr:hypothetical protein [Thermoanaerobaculia bacterium]
ALQSAPARSGPDASGRRRAGPQRRTVWLAAGQRQAPPELDSELAGAGFPCQRPTTPGRALAQAAGGEFAAIVVDLGDRTAGGLEMAVEMQAGRASDAVWIALAPAELTSSERKRLIEYVEGAAGSAGSAISAAALRVTRGAAEPSGETPTRPR